MGYRIQYRPIRKIRAAETRKARRAALTALCFLLFLILVNLFWPEGTAYIREILLPGDVTITTAAMEELAEELKRGEGVLSAVETFFRKLSGNMAAVLP